jgi:hypothetical protein
VPLLDKVGSSVRRTILWPLCGDSEETHCVHVRRAVHRSSGITYNMRLVVSLRAGGESERRGAQGGRHVLYACGRLLLPTRSKILRILAFCAKTGYRIDGAEKRIRADPQLGRASRRRGGMRSSEIPERSSACKHASDNRG